MRRAKQRSVKARRPAGGQPIKKPGSARLFVPIYGILQQNGKNGPLSPGAAVGVKVKSRTASLSSVQPPGVAAMVPRTGWLVSKVQGSFDEKVTVPGVVSTLLPEKPSMKLALIAPPLQISSTAQFGSKPEQIILSPAGTRPSQE